MALGRPDLASQDKLRQDRGVRRIASNAWEGVKDIVGDSRGLLSGLVMTAAVLAVEPARAQDVATTPVPGAPAPANPGGKKPPVEDPKADHIAEPDRKGVAARGAAEKDAGLKKEAAEQEGIPKYPPVLSWKVKVTLSKGKNDRVINLTRTADGKSTQVEFEGYIKADNPVFELPVRLPVDTSEKEKARLTQLVAKALVTFFQKGDVDSITSALEKGRIPTVIEPKTIDWEVLAEQKSEFTAGHVRRTRLVNDGASTIAISSDKEGGYVVRVKEELPANIDPSNIAHESYLRRILFGERALVLHDEDTFERRGKLGEGERDRPGFEPHYRVIRHAKKPEDKVFQQGSDLKKE